jgi:hypothetical protein
MCGFSPERMRPGVQGARPWPSPMPRGKRATFSHLAIKTNISKRGLRFLRKLSKKQKCYRPDFIIPVIDECTDGKPFLTQILIGRVGLKVE